MKKRILSFLLALCLLFSTLPVSVFATGSCGNRLIWRLSDDGVLTISGTGKMLDWTTASQLPWVNVREEIRSVVIEEGVTTIGGNAFLCCTNMTSVSIPSTVTSIGEYAFFECESLTTVAIPSGVKTIKEGTFWGCTSLEGITIPASVTSIGFCAFYLCSALKSVTIPGKVTIGEYAFEECTALSAVTFSGTAAKIGSSAFLNCTGLTRVNFPASVTQIGGFAFSGCTSLEQAVIPQGLTTIDLYAFSRCTSLNTVSIPGTVTTIAEGAFSGCTALSEVTIPGSVTSLGNFAFNRTGLKEIFFEGGAPAFNGSSIFSEVTATAWYDGDDATWTAAVRGNYGGKITWKPYAQSTAIASGVCGDDLVWVLEEDGVLTISGQGAMYDFSIGGAPWYDYRSSILFACIEDGVTQLGDYAFTNCRAMTGISIADSVTTIKLTFYNASALKEVTLPANLETLYGISFYGCTSLEEIVIPDGITNLMNDTFYGCTSLSRVILPEGLTQIGSRAFYGCTALKNITIPGGVKRIGMDAFRDCTALEEISLPNTLTELEAGAFQNCTSLKEFTIPSGCTRIEGSLFMDCTNLESVTTHKYITFIGYWAFAGCGKLQEITLYDRLSYIGGSAFRYCTSLTQISIPDSVTTIPENAFDSCTNLAVVNLPDSITTIEKNAFAGCGFRQITIPDGVRTIGNGAFSYCTNLEKIEFPDSVTSLGNMNDCTSLREVILPAGLTKIADSMFSRCTSLTTVEIPESVTSIGNLAFHCCDSLTTLVIPANVTSLGHQAIDYCPNLKNIYFHGDAPAISENNFYEVTANGWYPAGNTTWTASVMRDYRGHITWNPMFPTAANGTCGEKLNWRLDSEGVLTISGSGDMDTYDQPYYVPWHAYRDAVKAIVVEEGVTSIGDYAFIDCANAVSVQIPRSVTAIQHSAFASCGSLSAVELPDNLVSIGSTAFSQCHGLETLTIPGSVTSMGTAAFQHCYGLKSVVIREGVTVIGSCAFSGSYNLSQVTLPDSLVTIEDNAFSGCDLTEIRLPEGLRRIEEYAFSGNHNLTAITIPEGVTDIGRGLFANCTGLKEVCFRGDAPAFDNIFFYQVTATVYYPADNATWTPGIRQNYGGSITWAPAECERLGREHVWESQRTAPTCTEQGYTTHTCTACGVSFVDSYVDAGGHRFWAGWHVINAAGCTESGLEGRTCIECDHTETRPVAPLGHSYQIQVTAPTCEAQGYTTHTCTGCGDTFVDSHVGAKGHSFRAEWRVINAAGCTESGLEGRTCSECDHTETRTIDPLGHSYQIQVTAPTCEAQGYTTHTCTACGDTFVDSYVGAKGHSFRAEWRVINAAGCIESGLEGRDCTACGYRETRPIAPLGHSYQIQVTAPTCEAQGYTTHSCTRCNANYRDNYTNALGHTAGAYVRENIVESTCTEKGQFDMVIYCTVCNTELGRYLCTMPANGHSYDHRSETVAPTCTEQGYTTHICHCGHSFTDNYVSAAGHSWSGWNVVKEPTSTENGLQERRCAVCGVTERQDIPRLEVVCGDSNGDGRVNGLDLILVRQCLAGWDVTADRDAADLNGDGRVNALDLILLRQYLAGWDVTLGR